MAAATACLMNHELVLLVELLRPLKMILLVKTRPQMMQLPQIMLITPQPLQPQPLELQPPFRKAP